MPREGNVRSVGGGGTARGGNHCRSFMRPLRKVGKKGKKRRGRERGWWEGKVGGGRCDDPGDGKVGPQTTQATQGHTPHAAPAATGEGKKFGLKKGWVFWWGSLAASWATPPLGGRSVGWLDCWAGAGQDFLPAGSSFFSLTEEGEGQWHQWDGGVRRVSFSEIAPVNTTEDHCKLEVGPESNTPNPTRTTHAQKKGTNPHSPPCRPRRYLG